MKDKLISDYSLKRENIARKISEFNNLPPARYFDEFIFCTLTPQSNAQRCWSAVQEIKKLKSLDGPSLISILKKKTRFHNNKARYIMHNISIWKEIEPHLNNPYRKELRNFISEKVKGYGLKEASHFLRNIGKSDNQIAILDRHILKNLKNLGVITDEKIKNNKHYHEIEDKFVEFSKSVNIPIDHLDLLFWSQENGEIFK